MSNLGRLSLFSTALACLLLANSAAVAQQSRGTLKVQPRYFNPFAVVNSSQLGVNPFGGPDFSAFSSPFFAEESVAEEEATVTVASSVEPVVTSSPVVVPSSGRPSYTPSVRSPFRPPPRPSF